jgi:hypothetical protein
VAFALGSISWKTFAVNWSWSLIDQSANTVLPEGHNSTWSLAWLPDVCPQSLECSAFPSLENCPPASLLQGLLLT